jgi:uncharacterized protein YndB with AHSA1/START domain
MIDIAHHINTARRHVGGTVLEAGEARTVTISRTYDTDIDDLWDACTNPQRIPRWFLPISGDLRAGGRYQLEGNAGGTIDRCKPPHEFTATWEFGGSISWIAVRLTSMSDRQTRFELDHTVRADDHWDQFGPGAVGVGWDLGLIGLHLHLASGEPVARAPVEAWIASDDGQRFITLSSRRWCEANVAGGANPAEASSQAERTTAAYTQT